MHGSARGRMKVTGPLPVSPAFAALLRRVLRRAVEARSRSHARMTAGAVPGLGGGHGQSLLRVRRASVDDRTVRALHDILRTRVARGAGLREHVATALAGLRGRVGGVLDALAAAIGGRRTLRRDLAAECRLADLLRDAARGAPTDDPGLMAALSELEESRREIGRELAMLLLGSDDGRPTGRPSGRPLDADLRPGEPWAGPDGDADEHGST